MNQHEINRFFLDDIQNEEHPSDFEYTPRYAVLILRLPYIKERSVSVVSYAFLIEDGTIYRFSRSKKGFVKLGSFQELHRYLDIRIDKILAKITRLQSELSRMEDELYDGKIGKNFATRWLGTKKELALIERLMSPSIVAFGRFYKHFKKDLDELAFSDLMEHLERARAVAKEANEKADYLFNFYKLLVDEKMNSIMFVLTVLSAIFLPLTLATGFFGMNTGGLPFVSDPEGTWKVTLLVLVLEIPFIVWILRMMRR